MKSAAAAVGTTPANVAAMEVAPGGAMKVRRVDWDEPLIVGAAMEVAPGGAMKPVMFGRNPVVGSSAAMEVAPGGAMKSECRRCLST